MKLLEFLNNHYKVTRDADNEFDSIEELKAEIGDQEVDDLIIEFAEEQDSYEPRVFLINYDNNSEAFDNIKNPSDEEFMDEAELQGTVFTLEGFVTHFNMSYSKINQETDSIRIISVPV
jgi:hypothetical protein